MSDSLTPEPPESPQSPRSPQSPESNATPRAAEAGRAPGGAGWERDALERIALAAIREQRAARRWRIFFRFAFLIVLLLIAWRVAHNAIPRGETGRHTALVSLNGEIAADKSANAEDIDRALDRAFEARGTAGVVLHIDSPGGSPVESSIINGEIRRLRAKYPAIPLYVVVGDMCASGAYYVAVASDKIYVNPASIVGSIGVLMNGFGFVGLMDKLGIERRLRTSGENKGFYDPFSPDTPKMDAHAQAMLDQIHAQFIAAVKAGRGNRLHESPDIFSGLFWTGEKSVSLGLADGFGDTGQVARDIIKAPKIVDYTVRQGLTDRLAKRFGTAVGSAMVHEMAVGGSMVLR